MRIQKHGVTAPVFTGLVDDLSLEHQIELTAHMLMSDKSIGGCIGSDPVEHKLASAFMRQPGRSTTMIGTMVKISRQRAQ